jgi:hypothetical protein
MKYRRAETIFGELFKDARSSWKNSRLNENCENTSRKIESRRIVALDL